MKPPRFFTVCGVLAALLLVQGCCTPPQTQAPEQGSLQLEGRVDFSDPLLARRQVLLFGKIDQRVAETVIQKLLFLDGPSHAPIELYLQTPGGDLKSALAIEQIMRHLQSPVNTYALSECNSGGTMLLAAGTGRRRAFRGAVVVLHGLNVHGEPPPGFTEQIEKSYTDFWRRRARLPDAWFPLSRGAVHVLSAELALEYGIIDEVVER